MKGGGGRVLEPITEVIGEFPGEERELPPTQSKGITAQRHNQLTFILTVCLELRRQLIHDRHVFLMNLQNLEHKGRRTCKLQTDQGIEPAIQGDIPAVRQPVEY